MIVFLKYSQEMIPKLLYGLMLDRMSLSMKNGCLDDENRAYIIYTIDNIREDLGCSKEKAVKVLAELDANNRSYREDTPGAWQTRYYLYEEFYYTGLGQKRALQCCLDAGNIILRALLDNIAFDS